MHKGLDLNSYMSNPHPLQEMERRAVEQDALGKRTNCLLEQHRKEICEFLQEKENCDRFFKGAENFEVERNPEAEGSETEKSDPKSDKGTYKSKEFVIHEEVDFIIVFIIFSHGGWSRLTRTKVDS